MQRGQRQREKSATQTKPRNGIILGMKSLVFLLPLIVPAAVAAGVAAGPLPAPDYADTEVSTNFAFSVGEGQSRGIEIGRAHV